MPASHGGKNNQIDIKVRIENPEALKYNDY